MTKLLNITDPREIPRIVSLIHDHWLDAESVNFDSEKSTLNIRYLKKVGSSSSFASRSRFPALECFLRIFRVKSLVVRDTQKVRFYDINTLVYDAASMSLLIKTGIPFEIRAVVADLDVSVEETDAVVQD